MESDTIFNSDTDDGEAASARLLLKKVSGSYAINLLLQPEIFGIELAQEEDNWPKWFGAHGYMVGFTKIRGEYFSTSVVISFPNIIARAIAAARNKEPRAYLFIEQSKKPTVIE